MISAVIPVYNEAQRLPACVAALSAELERRSDTWELVLVDDGSSDGTGAVIEELVAARPEHLRGCHHPKNLGKGAAVRTGVLATVGELVLFCDTDLSTPIETLAVFLERVDAGADVVVGNRKSAEASIEKPQSPLRTWMGLGFTRLANAMTGLTISDYTCGFKLFRGDAARTIFEATETPRWSFDVEILARAAQMGLTIAEVPIRWINVEDSRVRLFSDTVGSFLEVLSIRRRLGGRPRRGPPPSDGP